MKQWKQVGFKRRSGILAPLFSVYSANSLGVGDFGDIRLLVDFCRKTRNSIIQFLPLNEFGALNCPYDAVSSFALEPVYLALDKIDCAKKALLKQKIEALRKMDLSCASRVDYGIKRKKLQILWEVFDEQDCSSQPVLEFISQNNYWLKDFAAFKVLKELNQGRAWYEWPDVYKNRNEAALASFLREYDKEILFQVWLQYLAYEQLKEAKGYAKAKGVLLKGDLPILVSRDSADVWSHPEYFKLEFAAGAPPDMYCSKGQRWGMPTYNWGIIAEDGYQYLKEKLKYAENFYDILRIDHVVGLFRIWSIPYNEPEENIGLNGAFDPADERLWKEHGKNILSVMLGSSDMLLCAEDLGTIPRICPETLQELCIPGNDVQRWVKDWKDRHDFLPPDEYREFSVAMLSTHDTTNWTAWWEYEAGTVDEALFIRKCVGRLDYAALKAKLFDPALSRYGRLRWLDNIDSVEKLVAILGRRKEELLDFVEMYENSYREKEKLWKILGFVGALREKCDVNIIKHALKLVLNSRAVFCINTLVDWLYLTGIFQGDPYQYRINTPSTISDQNWSLRLPLSLEELLKSKLCGEMKDLVASSSRI